MEMIMQCSIVGTRRCPSSYGDDGCGERLCARFETDDEAPWREDQAVAELAEMGCPIHGRIPRVGCCDAICGAHTTATVHPCVRAAGHDGWHVASLGGGSTHEWAPR
jgi:hypothetical protein